MLKIHSKKMQKSNYQTAKEEGIKEFESKYPYLSMGTKDPSSFLSFFAEKIKEGVEADIAGNFDCRCKDRMGIPKHKDNKCDCKCHHLKAMSSDSQTIKVVDKI